jgi:ketosteroid isomerase-like protein
MSDEAEIRSLLEQRARAIHDKDAETAVGFYAEGIVNFDLAPPLAQRGKQVTDPEGTRQWFATWEGPIEIRLADTTVRVAGNTAYAFGFVHMPGKRTDGTLTDVWARSTVCLERRGTRWEIVHEHTSFPMLMDGTEKAATGLKPEDR